MDRAAARAELWRRYDAGELSADELEARLQLLDQVDDDDTAGAGAAVDGVVPLRRRVASRRVGVVAAAVLGTVALAGGVAVVAAALGDDGDRSAVAGAGAGVAGPGPVPVPPGVVPGPTVVDGAPGCDDLPARAEDSDESAANPALLSEPPFVPDGYDHGDDDTIEPGADTDIALSTAAGTPLPVEIAGRELGGDLVVRLRTFRYGSVEDARAAAESAAASACSFGAGSYEVPDRPEITGSVVSGPIPTTAFASWRVGDRRFVVTVEAEGDDPDDLTQAQALAGAIAAAELDAARNPPAAPAP